MRYIQKQPTPQFFIDDTQGLDTWKSYGKRGEKRRLKAHILENEQFHLCVYCEGRVEVDASHLEHIKPKASHMYPELMFAYANLAVSCNGTLFNADDDNKSRHCGHKKDSEYDQDNFIDPTCTTDVVDYFCFDLDDHTILPTPKKPQSAQYTINVLRLIVPV